MLRFQPLSHLSKEHVMHYNTIQLNLQQNSRHMKKSITIIMKAKNQRDPQERIKKVSRGYAFNYLIPQQIAEVATKGKIKHLSMLQKIASSNKDLAYSQSISIKNKLDSMHAVHIRKKCSSEQLIFGSISEQDIVRRISELTGQSIDKRQVAILSNKKLGKYVARITIEEKIEALINLCIIPKAI